MIGVLEECRNLILQFIRDVRDEEDNCTQN